MIYERQFKRMKAGCLTISILSDKTFLKQAKRLKKESKEKQIKYDKDPQPQDFYSAIENTKSESFCKGLC